MTHGDKVSLTVNFEGSPEAIERIAEALGRKKSGLVSTDTDVDQDFVAFFRAILDGEPDLKDEELMNRVRKSIAQAAIDQADGNITQAAKRLGMARYGLQKRLKSGVPSTESETPLPPPTP